MCAGDSLMARVAAGADFVDRQRSASFARPLQLAAMGRDGRGGLAVSSCERSGARWFGRAG